jgi:transcriptional regulator with XRE-family HTH domain
MMTPIEHREFVGRNLMLLREALGLRPKEFADRLGITMSGLWNIEAGRSYPGPMTLYRATQEFGITADWLIRGSRASLPNDMAQKLLERERDQA